MADAEAIVIDDPPRSDPPAWTDEVRARGRAHLTKDARRSLDALSDDGAFEEAADWYGVTISIASALLLAGAIGLFGMGHWLASLVLALVGAYGVALAYAELTER